MPYEVPRCEAGASGAIAARITDAWAPMPMPHSTMPIIAATGPPRKARGALSAEAQVARIIAPMPIRSNRDRKSVV